MAETRWTPGPYKAVMQRPVQFGAPGSGEISVRTDLPFQSATIRRNFQDERGRRATQFVAEIRMTHGKEEECEPTAHLLAAAPDLYAEVQKLVTYLRENGDHSDLVFDAEDVMKRARGEA